MNREFDTTLDGKPVRVLVKRPDAATRQKAQVVFACKLKELADAGVPFQDALARKRAEQQADAADRAEVDRLRREIDEDLRKVPDDAGRVRAKGVTKAQAEAAAVRVRVNRFKLYDLLGREAQAVAASAEGIARNRENEWLVAQCARDAETGRPVFQDVEDYLARADRGEDIADRAASEFAFVQYGLSPDFDKDFPENKYLDKLGWFKSEATPPEETFTLEDETDRPDQPVDPEGVQPKPPLSAGDDSPGPTDGVPASVSDGVPA